MCPRGVRSPQGFDQPKGWVALSEAKRPEGRDVRRKAQVALRPCEKLLKTQTTQKSNGKLRRLGVRLCGRRQERYFKNAPIAHKTSGVCRPFYKCRKSAKVNHPKRKKQSRFYREKAQAPFRTWEYLYFHKAFPRKTSPRKDAKKGRTPALSQNSNMRKSR